MTIELRQLLIRSRVGNDESEDTDIMADSEARNHSPGDGFADSLLDELDEWKHRLADHVKSPRER